MRILASTTGQLDPEAKAKIAQVPLPRLGQRVLQKLESEL